MISRKIVAELTLVPALIFSLSISSVYAEEPKAASSALSGLVEQAGALAESGALGEMLNVNSATPEMLAAIPGIGPKLGEGIASYREAHGAFTGIKDLLNVEGIDMSLIEKIKPFLTF